MASRSEMESGRQVLRDGVFAEVLDVVLVCMLVLCRKEDIGESNQGPYVQLTVYLHTVGLSRMVCNFRFVRI